ncbi:MAG: hypothetical protein M0P76_06200 [Candidatus Pacebacteria bacterium]|jgi:hypothetical protein|nr:hypothetical protein [Candidatus Paceibacterota bacterium]
MNQNKIQEKKDLVWKEQSRIFRKIKENGFEVYASSLKKLSDMFGVQDGYVRCVDEGTPGGFHAAGSGILRSKKEMLKIFRDAGVRGVTSHDGCGAAKMFAKANCKDETCGDAEGKKWAKELASELGVPYRHISFAKMQRPKEFHISRAAYYDGTGCFNFGDGKKLPPGYIISRQIQSEKASLSEILLGLNISFGPNGFGERITEDEPFILVAVGKTKTDTVRLKKELRSLEHPYGKKVIIDGFTAPRT